MTKRFRSSALMIMLSLSFANVVSYASQETQSARWVGSGERWQVSDNAGGYLKNTWFQDDVTGHWYMLGAEDGSVMYAGLITDQSTGKTYLLNTNHDGTYGRMLTENGAYTINGKVVSLSFDQSHDGTYGAITSGLSDARSTGVEEKKLDSIPTDSNSGSSAGNISGSSSSSNSTSETAYTSDGIKYDKASADKNPYGIGDIDYSQFTNGELGGGGISGGLSDWN